MTQITSKPINLLMALITSENAAEMAKRSWEARRAKQEAEAQTAEQSQQTAIPLDFAQQRLSRVRIQLDRIDALAAEETDPKQLKFLADAAGRLQEQERQLAGRPLPGTLKPSSRQPKRTELPEPTPIQPVVVAPQSGQSSSSSEPPKSS